MCTAVAVLTVAALGAACGSEDEAATTAAAPAASAATTEAATTEEAATTAEETTDTAETAETDTAAADGDLPPGVVQFEEPEAGSGEGMKLGYISLGEAVPFARLVTNSLKEQAAKAGAQLIVCDSALDGQKALDCARNFKTQGVQGYLNFQVDQKSSPAICAAGPDVPVIAIDIIQPPCQTAFMGAANEYAGELAGRALGEFIKEKFNCEYDAYVSMESTAAGDANKFRMGGYRKGFTSVCGEIKNERILDGADRIDPARTQFTDTLTALPGKKVIVLVGINDDGLIGGLAAARTAGREGDVYMAGQGADPTAWCDIKNNPNWVGDVAYFPERYGEIGIPYLIRAVKGEEIPEDLLVPHQVVNRDNIDDIYTLKDCK
jgi:ribose transport system substrate-binding protein